MSDLFHEDVPENYIQSVFDVMQRADWHVFQVLTKRAERLQELAPKLPWPDNVWIDALRTVPAHVRFLSCEPLLGPLDLDLRGIHWVIVGGESGPRARPMQPEWARSILDQCKRANVPFFFKQWGAHDESGRRVGKGKAGRLLKRRTWDAMPPISPARSDPSPESRERMAVRRRSA
jgi:protein gp37